jgi:RNA polymerase sigma-70 factor (ECF subfamily)
VEGRTPVPSNQLPTAGESLRAGVSDRDLAAAVLRKDRKAAAQFVAAHIDAVYAYVCYRLAPRGELVDDVVQDVFLAALNGLETFHGESSLRTWIVGIARHKIEDVYRQRLRMQESLDEAGSTSGELFSSESLPDEQLDKARIVARARNVLAQLPERYRLLLLWRYWEHRSARDMAAAIGATEKSIERSLARARARFKELWVKE